MQLSPEEENFVKITKVIVEIVPKFLRKCFIEKWDKKYPNRKWKSNEASGKFLFQELPSTTKNDWRKKKYIDNLKKGNEQDWDTTILVFAMLYSGLNLMEPCRPREQRTEPLRVSEAIDIIRNIRNVYFAHAISISCPYKEYARVMKDIRRTTKLLFHGADKEVHQIIAEAPVIGLLRRLYNWLSYAIEFVALCFGIGRQGQHSAGVISYVEHFVMNLVARCIVPDVGVWEIDQIYFSYIEGKLTDQQLKQIEYEKRRQEELESLLNN